MLSQNEQEELLKQFPNIKLSYETIVSKIIYDADFYLKIPEGNKYFAWFAYYKNQNVCILMEIVNNNKINNLKIINCFFHRQLSNNTIFYGTLVKKQDFQYFFIEDLLYYKGEDYRNYS